MNLVLVALLIAIGINLLMFIPAYKYKTDKLTDLSYALTFAIVAAVCYGLSEYSYEQFLLFLMVLAWAYRLGSFLFIRIRTMKRDKRFDGMRENFWKFLKFWLAQGVSVFVILLPAVMAWQSSVVHSSTFSNLGPFVFLLGLSLESRADLQKFRFNQNAANKGKWIESGVWRLSRHPNYLGEMLVWIGMYMYTLQLLTPTARLVGLISPLYIIGLLLFVSGVPLLEKSADKKWGGQKDYQAYKKRTPLLVPSVRTLKYLFS